MLSNSSTNIKLFRIYAAPKFVIETNDIFYFSFSINCSRSRRVSHGATEHDMGCTGNYGHSARHAEWQYTSATDDVYSYAPIPNAMRRSEHYTQYHLSNIHNCCAVTLRRK